MEPMIVTSRPSRIHTAPRPMRIDQCQRDQGSRSSRAGMLVLMRPVSTPLDMASPFSESEALQRVTCNGASTDARTSGGGLLEVNDLARAKRSRSHEAQSTRVGTEVMSLHRDEAPGLHRIEDGYTNWYLIQDGTPG